MFGNPAIFKNHSTTQYFLMKPGQTHDVFNEYGQFMFDAGEVLMELFHKGKFVAARINWHSTQSTGSAKKGSGGVSPRKGVAAATPGDFSLQQIYQYIKG